MSKMSDIDLQKNAARELLSGLVGGSIVAVEAVSDDTGNVWPVLLIVDEKGNLIQAEISSDVEGNGPGYMALGLIKSDDHEFYRAIYNSEDWASIKNGN